MKGVVLDGTEVLLARNHRDEWELPGGRPEADETPRDAVVREVAEEAGLTVRVDAAVHVEEFEVVPGRWVTIQAFRCRPAGARAVSASDEHAAVGWFAVDALPLELPAVYRRAIAGALAL